MEPCESSPVLQDKKSVKVDQVWRFQPFIPSGQILIYRIIIWKDCPTVTEAEAIMALFIYFFLLRVLDVFRDICLLHMLYTEH